MGNLSNLYISQSFQSLIHLGTDGTASASLIGLEDGYGNPIGISVNTAGDLSISGTFSASLQNGYTYVGNSLGKTIAVATSSLQTNTGSLVTTSSFNSYTASNELKWYDLGLQSGSWITESETGSFARTNETNTFTADQIINGNLNVSGVISASVIHTIYETASVIFSSGSNQLGDELTDIQTLSGSVKVQGSLTLNGVSVLTSSADISALNAFTASQLIQNATLENVTASLQSFTQSADIRLDNLEINSASVNISINQLNAFTASQSTASIVTSITNLNSYTASNDVKWSNLESVSGSWVTSNITASSLITASILSNVITFTKGDASTFDIAIVDTTDLGPLNQFTASQESKNLTLENVTSSLQLFTQSADIRLDNLELNSASVNISIANINLATESLNISVSNINAFTESADIRLDNLESKSASVDTSISNLNQYTQSNDAKWTNLDSVSGSWITESETGSFLLTGSSDLIQTLYGRLEIDVQPNVLIGSTGLKIYDTSTDASGSMEFGVTGPGNPFIKLKEKNWFQFGAREEIQYQNFTSSFSNGIYLGNTGQARLGFIPTSGSLAIFSGNNFGRILDYPTAAPEDTTNIVFVNNSGNTTAIISGSNNIFTNPTTVTSGFIRYVGGSQNYFGLTLPQLTGSAAFSPSMNQNIINTGMLLRVPTTVTSAYTMNGNVLMNAAANGVQLGTSAVTNFEKATAGFTMNNNIVNGNIIATAYKTPLSASVTISSNNVGGAITANCDSSSINVSAMLVQGGLTINNSYFPTTITPGTGFTATSAGVSMGSNFVYYSGSNTTMAGPPRSVSNFSMIGTANAISASLNGDNASVNSTSLLGQSLTVVGSNSRATGLSAADWGSVFVGRWNAVDGNREQTAKNVFVVGTGTSGANRKSGFLIDSGSNTYVEGTLNVSGSTSMTGSVNISQTLTLGSFDPLPAGTTGMLAVSQSLLWFYDATQWRQVSLI